MQCRENCGACCIAPSISSPIPGMPEGKPAGVVCIHLAEDLRCGIYDQSVRPKVCAAFKADLEICGNSKDEAMMLMVALEQGKIPE